MGNGRSVEGLRVVQVAPGSPMEEGGLQSYLDFVLEANGSRLTSSAVFSSLVSKSVGNRINLKVFNILTREIRDEVVVPRQDWGGTGLLGGTVRYEDWNPEGDFGIRVLSVVSGSPAEAAGLVPEEDYILGTDSVTLSNVDQLASVARQSGRELPIYVFSLSDMRVRIVTLKLSGDTAILGIDAGTGALHSLPNVLKARQQGAAETRSHEERSVPQSAEAPPLSELPPVQEPPLLPPPPAFTASTVPHRSQKEKHVVSAPTVLKNPFQTD